MFVMANGTPISVQEIRIGSGAPLTKVIMQQTVLIFVCVPSLECTTIINFEGLCFVFVGKINK